MGCGRSKDNITSPRQTKEKVDQPLEKKVTKHKKQKTVDLAFHRDIREDYKFGRQIGAGHFGRVRLATYYHDKGNKKQYAVKTIAKKIIQPEDMVYLRREIDIQKILDHPNIAKLYEVYEDNEYLHLVMEACLGGELFDNIIQVGRYSEKDAAKIIRQMMHSISFMHANGVAHRDLKPENFLFETKAVDSALKLIDFGLSAKFAQKNGETQDMSTIVGTPYYVAPEVFAQKYGPECDIWGIGVIMYILLCGSFPFQGNDNAEVLRAVIRGKFDLQTGAWKKISEYAKDLVAKLLWKTPDNRIKIDDALRHPWFDTQGDAQIIIDASILTSLQQYQADSKMQMEAMHVLVQYLEVDQIGELRRIFHSLDTLRTGYITYEELEDALQRAGIEAASTEIKQIIENIDYHGDGQISYSEFLVATVKSKKLLTEETLWNAFKRFDTDNSGTITADNLAQVMRQAGQELTKQQIEDMIKEVDFMSDNQISFNEFKCLMMPGEAVCMLED